MMLGRPAWEAFKRGSCGREGGREGGGRDDRTLPAAVISTASSSFLGAEKIGGRPHKGLTFSSPSPNYAVILHFGLFWP